MSNSMNESRGWHIHVKPLFNKAVSMIRKLPPAMIYVETTIFSFYYETRTDPEIIAQRQWTQQWWNTRRSSYDIVTSVAVLDELDRGDYPHKAASLALARKVPSVPISDEVRDVVKVYIRHHVMPSNPAGDALHLAIASCTGCNYLLTWNCQHLANANKFGHIQRVNAMIGLRIPYLVTPLELMGVSQ